MMKTSSLASDEDDVRVDVDSRREGVDTGVKFRRRCYRPWRLTLLGSVVVRSDALVRGLHVETDWVKTAGVGMAMSAP
jgi:hypothetical protein